VARDDEDPEGYVPSPHPTPPADPRMEPAAFALLCTPRGPDRFARVGDGIYRGGQPTRRHLEILRELGVRTIVNLRRENSRVWKQEKLDALDLGLEFHRYPFYGVFGVKEAFLDEILGLVRRRHIYVHCKHGRDRTSLIVALYRVLDEAWDPELAWQREALDYGSAQTLFYRKIGEVYDRVTAKYHRLRLDKHL
jgi:protein tyrosine/serine phosphatase